MSRRPITVERWLGSQLTWPEFYAQQKRRERWLKRLGLLAGLVLACVLSWCAVGAAIGALP